MVVNPRRRLNTNSRNSKQDNAEPVDIDLANTEKRADYLKKKLDDILGNIGEGYSKKMAEELIERLERTLKGFHEDVSKMLNDLHDVETKRLEKEKPEVTEYKEVSEDEFSGMSEIEKKLEMEERERVAKEAEEKENSKSKKSKKKSKK